MPRLRKYTDQGGYYLRGHVPDVGFCVWQIGTAGLEHLNRRGISGDGASVPLAELLYLRDRELAWISGQGPPRSGATAPAGALPDLADGLRRWARRGGLPDLTRLLYNPPAADHRDRGFPADFLRWLTALDPERGLDDYAQLSLLEFDVLALPRLADLSCQPHRDLADAGETHVLWFLAQVVGLVAAQLALSPECPAAWTANREPLLHRLHARLAEPWRAGRGVCRRPFRRPFLRWEVEGQEVVWVLPEQLLPPDVGEVTWSVTPGGCPPPQIWPTPDGRRLTETRSRAVPVADRLSATWHLSRGPTGPAAQGRADLNLVGAEALLFDQAGTFLDWRDDLPRPPGAYWALIRRAAAPHLTQGAAVAAAERVDFGPVGWPGWQGWRLSLKAAAPWGPYALDAPAQAPGWEWEAPPATSLAWRGAHPVWIGRWPRVWLDRPGDFTDALLTLEGAGGPGGPAWLGIGRDVKVAQDPATGQPCLDLNGAAAWADCWGDLAVTCRWPHRPELPPLRAWVFRLPPLRAAYVPDPVHPTAAVVALQEPRLAPQDLQPEPGTAVAAGPEGALLLRAVDPVGSPAVGAFWAARGVLLRLRVPALRVGRSTPADGFCGWQAAPLADLDLRAVGVEDRLRIELPEPPVREGDHLLARLVGGGEVAAGWRRAAAIPLHAFEVELHRWRDGFGAAARGTIQVRGQRRWLDVARLQGGPFPAPAPPPPPAPGERGRLLAELRAALDGEADGRTRDAAAACQGHVNREGAGEVDRELVPVAVARALAVAGADVTHLDQARACLTGLAGRDDLPEAALAAVVADLRRNAHGPSPVPLTVARLQVLTDPLANTPGRLLVLAEGYYHLACDAAGPAPGYWQAVGDLAREFLATPAAQTHAADRAEALLLLELAALVQGLEVPAVGVGPPPPVRLAVWLDGLRRAALHLRTVWPAAGHPPGVAAALARTPAPLVLRPADARLIHFLAAQAERTPAARELGAGLPGWAAWQFPALGLARARQARWDGRTAEAQAEYAQVFEYADQNGRDDLLQVCVAERTS